MTNPHPTEKGIDGFTKIIMRLQEIHDSSTPWNVRDSLQKYINELEEIRTKRLQEKV